MSLLNGPHTILVFTKERVEDEMGYELVDRPPVRLTGVTVQAYFGQSGAIDEYPDGTQVRWVSPQEARDPSLLAEMHGGQGTLLLQGLAHLGA